jgi:hypothetical protein
MRRLATMALACALLAGCGADPGPVGEPAAPPLPRGDFGPVKAGSVALPRPVAPPRRAPGAVVARALAGGATGVVGVEGAVGVRPGRLMVSSDGELQGLRWTRWNAGTATGAGTLRLRDCDPSCAGGGIARVPATVVLSRPRVCGRARYFDRAEVTLSSGPAPASYVRAPC